MGITIRCKKTYDSIDMGSGGFMRLRNKVAELIGEPFAYHYKMFSDPKVMFLDGDDREAFFDEYDAKTQELIADGHCNIKVADFLYQSDIEGRIRYGACKQLLKTIGSYDDDILYGYVGRKDCARFSDFKQLLQECVENKCDLTWD